MAASCAPTSLRARPSSSAASSTLQNRFSWVPLQKPASTPSLVREFRELAARTLNVNAAETAVQVRDVDGRMQDVTNDVQFDETTARTIFEGVEGEGLQNEDGTLDLVQVRVDPKKRQQYYQALRSILEVYGASAVDEDEIADEKDAAREEGTLTPAEWVRNLVEKADKDVKRDTAIMSIASEIAPGMEADLLEEDIRKRLWAEWAAEYDAGDGEEGGYAEEDGDEMSEEDDAHRQLEAGEEAREGDEVDMRMGDEGAPADVAVGDGRYGSLQKYGLFEQVAEHGHSVVLNLLEGPDSDSGQMSTGTKVAKFLKAVEDSGNTEYVFHHFHFRMFAPALRANKDIVEAGVRTDVHNFGQASDELALDADFICERLLPTAGAQVYQDVLPELAHSPAFATRFLLRADAMYESREKEVAAAAAAEDGEETPDAPAEFLHKAERLNRRFGFGEALYLGRLLKIGVLDRNNKEHRKLVHFAMERGLKKKSLGLRWQYVERAKAGAKAGTSSSDKSEDDEDIDWVGEVDENVLHDLQKMAAVDKLHRIYRTQGLVLLPSTTADDVQEQFGVWKELSQTRWKFDAFLKMLEDRVLSFYCHDHA